MQKPWTTLGEYIEDRSSNHLVSRRAVARALNMSPAHLTNIVLGKITPGAEICNRISDYFNDPREIALRLAGWLKEKEEDEEEDEIMREFALAMRDDPDLQALYQLYKQQTTPAARRALVRKIKDMFG